MIRDSRFPISATESLLDCIVVEGGGAGGKTNVSLWAK